MLSPALRLKLPYALRTSPDVCSKKRNYDRGLPSSSLSLNEKVTGLSRNRCNLNLMSQDELGNLITRLSELQLQRQNILQEEQRITQRIAELPRRGEDDRHRAAHAPSRVSPPPPPAPRRGVFSVGQRVFIENRIRHVPFGRRASPADRAAVVHRVTTDKVHIVTYNGFETWRHPANIRHLTNQEHRDITEQQDQ